MKERDRETWITSRMAHVYSIGTFLGHEGSGELADATFRNKAGKEHQGYAANLEETVGSNGSVITDYQYEQNNYSDSQFLKDSLGRKECQEEADAKHY